MLKPEHIYIMALIGLNLEVSNNGCIDAPKLRTLKLVTIPIKIFLAKNTS